jgi:hypothetical protein
MAIRWAKMSSIISMGRYKMCTIPIPRQVKSKSAALVFTLKSENEKKGGTYVLCYLLVVAGVVGVGGSKYAKANLAAECLIGLSAGWIKTFC